MQASNDEVIKLLQQLTEQTNRVLLSYAEELKRLNNQQVAQYEAMKTQAEAIVESQEILNRHEEALALHEQGIAKLLASAFPDKAAEVMKKVPRSN